MRSSRTKFPNGIDDRLFLSDISLSQVPIMNEYRYHLTNGNYTMATELLNNSGVFFYGAWILNLLEERLCAIGKVIIAEDEHSLMTYEENEPIQLIDDTHWIGD